MIHTSLTMVESNHAVEFHRQAKTSMIHRVLTQKKHAAEDEGAMDKSKKFRKKELPRTKEQAAAHKVKLQVKSDLKEGRISMNAKPATVRKSNIKLQLVNGGKFRTILNNAKKAKRIEKEIAPSSPWTS